MKKFITLLFVALSLQSCIMFVVDGRKNPYTYPGYPYPNRWAPWYSNRPFGCCYWCRPMMTQGKCTDNMSVFDYCNQEPKNTDDFHYNNTSTQDVGIRTQVLNARYETNTYSNEENDCTFEPDHAWDSCRVNSVLTFNVFFGFGEQFVEVNNFPRAGGSIVFNVFANGHSMSMYEFNKYSFYTFTDNTQYCGYNSYSLDVRNVCKYELVISPNYTNHERDCIGYWSSNNDGSYEGRFRIRVIQSE